MVWLVPLICFLLLVPIYAALEAALRHLRWMKRQLQDEDYEEDAEEGGFLVRHGHYEVDIDVQREPSRVWISLDGEGARSVCLADVDKASVTTTPKGFVVVLDIASAERHVSWYAEF